VNFGSTVVSRPPRGRFGYVATKGAVEAMSRALAIDLGRDGIRVNVIRPGIIPSELRGLSEAEERARFETGTPFPKQALKAVGDGLDVARAVAWLAGDGGRWITGAVIDIDGGYVLGAADPA
jgi:NAD(P)-dependent dehydrogenase (short-subunit alcohol dehydrogenase family)